jgi:hypothetical protein
LPSLSIERAALGLLLCAAACAARSLGFPDRGGRPTDGGNPCTDVESDGSNCGRCGHSCLGAACQLGVCQPTQIQTEQFDAQSLIVDESRLYWISNSEGTISSMPKTGGSAKVLLSRDFPRALAVDTTRLYFGWANIGQPGEIRSMAKDGGDDTLLTTVSGSPDSLAVDDTHVYWATAYFESTGQIGRVDKAGGSPTVLADGRPNPVGLGVAAGHVCWTNRGSDRAADGSVECDGISIAHDLTSPAGLVFDGSSVFWASSGGAGIARGTLDGASPVTLASGFNAGGNLLNSTEVVSDGADLYWISSNNPVAGADGEINRVSKAGGGAQTLATGRVLRSVAVDDQRIYWTDVNTIWWLAK